MAGDCLTLRAGVRLVLAALRLGLFVPAVCDRTGAPGSAFRSTGDAVVPVKAPCASMAGEVKGLKNSSPKPKSLMANALSRGVCAGETKGVNET